MWKAIKGFDWDGLFEFALYAVQFNLFAYGIICLIRGY